MLWVAVAVPSCLRPVDAAAPPGRSRRGRGGAGHRRVGGRPRGRSLSGPYGRSGREVGGRPTLTFFSNGRHLAQRPRRGEVRALLTSPRRWHDRAPRAIVPTAGGITARRSGARQVLRGRGALSIAAGAGPQWATGSTGCKRCCWEVRRFWVTTRVGRVRVGS